MVDYVTLGVSIAFGVGSTIIAILAVRYSRSQAREAKRQSDLTEQIYLIEQSKIPYIAFYGLNSFEAKLQFITHETKKTIERDVCFFTLELTNIGFANATNPEIGIVFTEPSDKFRANGKVYFPTYYLNKELGRIYWTKFETVSETPDDFELATMIATEVAQVIDVIRPNYGKKILFGFSFKDKKIFWISSSQKMLPVNVIESEKPFSFTLFAGSSERSQGQLTDKKYTIQLTEWNHLDWKEEDLPPETPETANKTKDTHLE